MYTIVIWVKKFLTWWFKIRYIFMPKINILKGNVCTDIRIAHNAGLTKFGHVIKKINDRKYSSGNVCFIKKIVANTVVIHY